MVRFDHVCRDESPTTPRKDWVGISSVDSLLVSGHKTKSFWALGPELRNSSLMFSLALDKRFSLDRIVELALLLLLQFDYISS